MVSTFSWITVKESDQTASPRARAGMSRNKMGMPSLESRLGASREKPVYAIEPYAMIRPR
jgi:hypothetical protein